jgi:hypothetical protein
LAAHLLRWMLLLALTAALLLKRPLGGSSLFACKQAHSR